MKIKRRELSGHILQQDDSPLPEALKRIYAGRGINHEHELSHELKHLLPISGLNDIDKTAGLLAAAIQQQKRLLIVGDYDVDGASSTTLAVLALQNMGAQHVHYLVPDRFKYGYGLTPEIVEVAKDFSPDIIITVDNGISSHEGVDAANAADIQVIITDHHLPGKTLPNATAIVNPNLKNSRFQSSALAGVGVIFYVMLALKKHLQNEQWFAQQQCPIPSIAQYLDLVALGTVADVVPLDRNNRILVSQGLQRIRAGQCRAGIHALFQVAGRNIKQAVSSDLGYVCGPRLNAAGRLDDMSLGIECLLSTDQHTALHHAKQLDRLNNERRTIEQQMKQQALQLLEGLEQTQQLDDSMPIICLHHEEWHQGVIGILASRIKEQMHRPVITFASADHGLLRGSARSIAGLHMRDLIDSVATQHPDLIKYFGGHAMAAGLTLETGKLKTFITAIHQAMQPLVDANEELFDEIVLTDGHLDDNAFTLEFADTLRYAAPWGQHFPAPCFEGQFQLLERRVLKDIHLRLVLRPEQSAQQLDAIAFNINPDEWPQVGARLHLIYRLDINEFRGTRRLQLLVERQC